VPVRCPPRRGRAANTALAVIALRTGRYAQSAKAPLFELAEAVIDGASGVVQPGERSRRTCADRLVLVTGDAAAIADAPRNLIENALVYTASATEVVVEVDREGAISVPASAQQARPS